MIDNLGMKLRTLKQTAETLQISVRTLYRWMNNGAPCVVLDSKAAKHGKRYRFVPDDVIAWAKENLNNNTTGKEVEV